MPKSECLPFLLTARTAGRLATRTAYIPEESAGHHAAIVDNLWEHGGGKLENVNPKASFHKMDIRDTAPQKVFEEEQPEVICHLAAQHSVKISTDDPAHDASVNVFGLINLLQNATRFGARKVIFSSSGATYGTVEKMPVNEITT